MGSQGGTLHWPPSMPCHRKKRFARVQAWPQSGPHVTHAVALVAVVSLALAVPAAGQDRGRGAGAGQGAGAPPGRGRAAGPGYLKLFDSNMPFEPHDLAGIWTPNGNGFGGGGRCRDCGDRGYSWSSPTSLPQARRPSSGTSRRMAVPRTVPMPRRIRRNTSAGGGPSRPRSATTPTAPAIRWGCRVRLCIPIPSSSSCCPIASFSTSSGDTGCARSGWTDASCRHRKTSISLDGGAMPRSMGGQHAGRRIHRL